MKMKKIKRIIRRSPLKKMVWIKIDDFKYLVNRGVCILREELIMNNLSLKGQIVLEITF